MILQKILVFLSAMIFFSGCFGLRSAEGLQEGSLNINYIAPLATSVRFGVTDNVELRHLLIAGDAKTYRGYDIYLHSNNDSAVFNGGILLGLSTEGKKVFNGYYGLTVGMTNRKLSPYVSLIMGKHITTRPEIAVGTEMKFTLGAEDQYTIIVTPEVSGLIGKYSKDIYDGPIWGAINIGISYNIYSLLKH
jgi:hypothetical protein